MPPLAYLPSRNQYAPNKVDEGLIAQIDKQVKAQKLRILIGSQKQKKERIYLDRASGSHRYYSNSCRASFQCELWQEEVAVEK